MSIIDEIWVIHLQKVDTLLMIGPKIKFYLFGIAARPTEKLAVQIILFAFQTIFFLLIKSESRRNFDRVC